MLNKDFTYRNITDAQNTKNFIESKKIKKYVLGRNQWSKSIISQIKVDGVIDDFTDDKFFENLPIYNTNEIQKDNSIVVSATMGGPKTAKTKLDQLGIVNIDYFAFFKYSNLPLIPPPFLQDFKNIINFKITLDLKYMKEYNNAPSVQYFENDIYELPKNPIFVDGGGYTGDTSMNFIAKHNDYKKIYLFEPMKENMKQAKNNLSSYQNIEYFECGLSNFEGIVSFNYDDASSAIIEEGNVKINVNYLDNIIDGRVDFIKFDIEGAEQDAIDGAKRLIKTYNPILAICIYHKAEDWYKIPQKILSINSDYKIYLRHYMEGIFETVMYFVPKQLIKG